MATVVGTLLAGAIFGLALAAPPGPMNAVIAEESVVHGWTAGFRAGLGAMTADALFLLLSLLGLVAFVEQFPVLRAAMVAVGGYLMLYFAYGAARSAREAFQPDGAAAGSGGTAASEGVGGATAVDGAGSARGFRRALVLGLTNPYQILFWLTVGVGLLRPGTLDVLAWTPYLGAALAGTFVVETGSAALIAGLFGGIAAWIVAFPGALVTAQRRVESLAPVVAAVSALVLAGFGVTFLWDAARTLL